jgi:oligoendopeptidase F
VAVDEFQHGIYERPEMTPSERKAWWREVEQKYLPFKDYEDNAFFERGGFWFRQGHIFSVPFYYIDYTLAQVVAFQYWVKSRENQADALDSYVALCGLGGSKSFTGLLASQNLDNPFETGSVKKISAPIEAYLESVNDQAL